MAAFSRYIGIDYSGAETPESSLNGPRVYCAVGESEAKEVAPPPSPRKHWTRRGVARWLAERLAKDAPTIVGIDHGFTFPLRYFEVHRLPPRIHFGAPSGILPAWKRSSAATTSSASSTHVNEPTSMASMHPSSTR